jgi:hypothetical protein
MPKGAYRTERILEALRSGDKTIEELYQAVYPENVEASLSSKLLNPYSSYDPYRTLRVLISRLNRGLVKSPNIKPGTHIEAVEIKSTRLDGPRVKYRLVEPVDEGDT